MIFLNDIARYEQIIFYGCVKTIIDKYIKYLDIHKCRITDSNYKIWGTEYKGIPIECIEDLCANSERKVVIILPENEEISIYHNIRKKGFMGDVYFRDMVKALGQEGDKAEFGRYTIERHTQLLIAALKEYGIRNVVVSPGTCNMNFVYSLQNDSFFNLFSCVDERSAAYIACGISQATGEPTVLSCTGATASRNYMSALTEAYYSKIPILAVTSSRDSFMIKNGIDQVTDRLHIPSDVVGYATEITFISTKNEYEYCKLNIKKAISHLYLQGGRPVHINLITRFEKDFSFKTLPEFRKLKLFNIGDTLPMISNKTALFISPMFKMNIEIQNLIEVFSEKYGVIIIGDHLSNYKGKHFLNISLIADQKNEVKYEFDTLITVGEITKSVHIQTKKIWRIAEDNSIYDRDLKIDAYFDMSLTYFLDYYIGQVFHEHRECDFEWLGKLNWEMHKKIDQLPFSNIWVAKNILENIPKDSILYLGIYSSLKVWNYFPVSSSVKCYSTVGGFGIDGTISEMIGASLMNRDKLHIAVVGDLSFFYDLNVLGNKNIGNNVRIIVINNNGGHSLRNNNGLPNTSSMPNYVSAPDHFRGDVIKAYTESLGFEYILIESKKELLEKMSRLFESDKPVVFEVRYNSDNDSESEKILTELY